MLGTVPSKLGRSFSWIIQDKLCRCFINIRNLPVGWEISRAIKLPFFVTYGEISRAIDKVTYFLTYGEISWAIDKVAHFLTYGEISCAVK